MIQFSTCLSCISVITYCFCHVQHTAWVWKNYYCYSNTSSFWWTFILSFHSWCLFLAVVVASKLISIFVPQARNSSFKFPRLGTAVLRSSKDKLLGLVLFLVKLPEEDSTKYVWVLERPFSGILTNSCFSQNDINPIIPSVHKLVKYTVKILP